MNIVLPHLPVSKMHRIDCAWGTASLKFLDLEISNPDF